MEVEMKRNRRLVAVALATAAAAVLIAGFAHAANKEKPTRILLTLRVEVTGRTAVKVQPRDAKLWRNNPDKPKRVEWIAVNNTPYEEVFWEIRYDPSKGEGTADYFGDVDIECGQKEINVLPNRIPDSPMAEWPYSVTVYGCVDGTKRQELATLDPRVIWQD